MPLITGNARERRLTIARRVAVATWAAIVVYRTVTTGFAFNRELLLLYICTGLLAASIGQGRRMLYVVRDWLPFALVLVAYDLSRGAARMIGRPTMWHWQVDVDRWMFFGTMPTVWLQERLKLPYPPWWEIVISTVYMSFFILPYVVAAVLWLRDREEWKAFVRLFVGLSFAALIIYALLPAAPPWAAARCTAADVAGGPVRSAVHVPPGPRCPRRRTARRDADHPGRRQRLGRADRRPGLGQAEPPLRQRADRPGPGQRQPGGGDPVTARRPDRWRWRRSCGTGSSGSGGRCWWPTSLVMAFTLVYTAEHYVVDILLGWVLAAVVLLVIRCFESGEDRRPRLKIS